MLLPAEIAGRKAPALPAPKSRLRDLNETLFTLLVHARSCSKPGGTTTTTSGRTRIWAGALPPRSPANVSGGMPPDTLPSPQPTIMKERDSTCEW